MNLVRAVTTVELGTVTLTCACGSKFLATAQGARAGRKWCSGSCQDRLGTFGAKRVEWMREWRRRKRAPPVPIGSPVLST